MKKEQNYEKGTKVQGQPDADLVEKKAPEKKTPQFGCLIQILKIP